MKVRLNDITHSGPTFNAHPLMQILRAQRYPITASTLSERLGISVRSLYRDIKTLQHIQFSPRVIALISS
jgi:hypothetical protein